jgi:hypothetical protein
MAGCPGVGFSGVAVLVGLGKATFAASMVVPVLFLKGALRESIRMPQSGRNGKVLCDSSGVSTHLSGLALDVGCRSGNLKRRFRRKSPLLWTGPVPPADVMGNLERGLPFGNMAFDTVVALDVLEHTDDIHRAFGAVQSRPQPYRHFLPNAYDFKFRLRFLSGTTL